MLTLKSKNITTDLFRIGHAESASDNYTHYYALRYMGVNTSPNNTLKLIFNNGTADTEIM
jgi:hypothetical protein